MHAGKPATSTFIPPLTDSLLLDYQSPRAQLGYYPNELPTQISSRRHLLQVAGRGPHFCDVPWFPNYSVMCVLAESPRTPSFLTPQEYRLTKASGKGVTRLLQMFGNSSAPAVNTSDPASVLASLGKGICKSACRPM